MKKTLIIVLVLIFVLGTMTYGHGSPLEDIKGTDFENAVDTLSSLGIVSGYSDGTFKPEKIVTRAEMAKLIITQLGYGDLASAGSFFSDTTGHWGDGYIRLASDLNIVNGYPDGTFKPYEAVGYDEVVTMILRGLGYTDDSLVGSWPVNYKIKAIKLGIYKNIMVNSAGANRGSVAVLLYNGMFAEYGETDSKGIWKSSGKTMLSRTGSLMENVFVPQEYVDSDLMNEYVDLKPYRFHLIDYYANKSGQPVHVAGVKTLSAKGTLTTVDEGDDKLVLDSVHEYVTSSDIPINVNDSESNGMDVYDLSENGNCHVEVIYDPNDGYKVTGIIACQYEVKQIERTYNPRKPGELDGMKIPVDKEAIEFKGPASSIEDIAPGDIVYVYGSAEVNGLPVVATIEVVRDVYEGRVIEIRNTSNAVVGDRELFDGIDIAGSSIGEAECGSIITVYLDKDGKVFSWLESVPTVKKIYGLYAGESDGIVDFDSFGDNLGFVVMPRVRLFTEDGIMEVFNLSSTGLNLEESGSHSYGDVDIEYPGLQGNAEVTAQGVEEGDLMEYTLDSDGNIASISIADYIQLESEPYSAGDRILANKYEMTVDTLVFDLKSSDEKTWSVSDDSLLGNMLDCKLINDSGYNATVVVVEESNSSEIDDYLYGMITKITHVFNGIGPVQKLKVIVDGEEKTLNTVTIDTVDEDSVGYSTKRLMMSDGLVAGSEEPDWHDIECVSDVNGFRIREEDGSLTRVSEDVIVYIIDGASLSSSIGTLEDIIDGDSLRMVDEDDDGQYDIVILNLNS
jgi:hypothetical protein